LPGTIPADISGLFGRGRYPPKSGLRLAGENSEVSEAECIGHFYAEARLIRDKSFKLILLPAVVRHNKELLAGSQYPAQSALKPYVRGIAVILHEIGQGNKRRKE
jgi:hypothetical protein